MKFTVQNITKLGQYLLVLLLFFFIVWRAINLSFTHDEAYTYKFLIGFENPQNTANNHLLNTQLMSVSKSVFGMSEFALRLPNILAFLLYAFGYFLITSRTQIKHAWVLFAFYFFNPFVLDFFSLARGYGLSMGFLSLSLYGFLRFSNTDSLKKYTQYLLFSIISGGLSLFSNLSVINYFLVLIGFAILVAIRNRKTFDIFTNNKHLYIIGLLLAISIGLVLFSIDKLLYLRSLNQLYFGAEKLQDTLNSFTVDSLYGFNYPEFIYNTLRIIPVLFFIFGLLMLIIKLKQFFLQDILLMFPLIIFGYVAENLLFEAKFPMGRTTLFVYVVFLFFAAKSIKINKIKGIIVLKYLSLLVSVLVVFHFSNVINYTHVANWKYDASTKQVMKKVAELRKEKEVDFSVNWLFEPSANYYLDLFEIDMPKFKKIDSTLQSNYIYEFSNRIDTNFYLIIEEYPLSESVFAKRK